MRFARILPVYPLLALAALAACQPAVPDPRGVDRDETLLTVSATGRSETLPDEARFSLGVTSLAATAAEASAANNARMSRVSAALARFGVKPDDLQTANLGLARVDYGRDRGRYQANNTLTVRLRAVPRAGDAVLAATEAGANLVAGPTLRVSDPEAASMSAYAAAYRAARLRANAYAAAAGLKVTRILAIRDGGQSGGEPLTMDLEERAPPPTVEVSAAPPPPFNPGVNSSTVAVRVDFALDAK